MVIKLYFRVFQRSMDYSEAFDEIIPQLGGFDIESPNVIYIPLVPADVEPVIKDGKPYAAVLELVASRKVSDLQQADAIVELFSDTAVAAEVTELVKSYFLDREPS